MLMGLKAFIIQRVTAEVKANPTTGYKFGWLSSKDILAADDEKIKIKCLHRVFLMFQAKPMIIGDDHIY